MFVLSVHALYVCVPQGQVLSLGPNCSLMTADGRHLVGTDGEFLCLGPDGVTLVDAGTCGKTASCQTALVLLLGDCSRRLGQQHPSHA